jgi:hypothetical protein
MHNADPTRDVLRKFLEEDDVFFECLLLEYRHSPITHSFTWVGVPGMFFGPNQPNQPDRLFVRLHFTGVSGFVHLYPKWPDNRFKQAAHHFFAPDYVGTYESEHCQVSAEDSSYHLQINLPYLLGVLKFNFLHVEVTLLSAIPVQTGDTFIYVSAAQEAIDFYRPFGPLQDS